MLVTVKNISANKPSILLMVGMNTCQVTVMGERERERESLSSRILARECQTGVLMHNRGQTLTVLCVQDFKQ